GRGVEGRVAPRRPRLASLGPTAHARGGDMSDPVLHVTGPVLVGPEEVLDEVWVIDGVISLSPPSSGEVETVRGYAVPGLVDAHCHVGLEAHGAVTRERAEEHALADREAGALLLRDAGSPLDTRWVQEREDLPRLIR